MEKTLTIAGGVTMNFQRGFKLGEWIAFAALAAIVGALVYSCHKHGFGM